MASLPFCVRLAQVVGIVGAGWLSGSLSAFSCNIIPGLLHSRREDHYPASSLLKQWRHFSEKEKAQSPSTVAVSAAAFAYLAWSGRPGTPLATPSSFTWYCAAAALTLASIPFTFLAMSTTNRALLQKARCDAESINKEHEEVDRLVHRWSILNGVHSLLPFLGCVAGVMAISS
ncbi:hypothetical protein BDV26DRAFT_253837 [Aspergillus bertholletiae]|uniref:DUF1772-domain-containing protein n=1 Tax=Aspergillus bertholletiae TaxID=1226010 RepID=A0A5N7BLH9_9EURO|nr:hypothetical protein BDV26DRAFT_253837 [Aspergillus bertholletiae]